MTTWLLIACVLGLSALPASYAQSPSGTLAQLDARAEVTAALYAASATQAAAERVADAKIGAQRKEIDKLRAEVLAGATQLKTTLTAAEERYVAALAARDRVYAQEIAVFRAAVENIASTPAGAAALAQFNAGDEVGALAVLDDLRAARDAARKKRAEIESAAEGRRIASLALEARARGKLTTAAVIGRYEEVTRLDPGAFWGWIEVGRLYQNAGRLADALRAATAAADAAQDEQARSVALGALGDVQEAQGNLTAALESYRASHAIDDRLANADPGATDRQDDLAISHDRIGHVQQMRSMWGVKQGNVFLAPSIFAAALESFRAALAIRERLAKADPGNAGWQRGLAISHVKIGDVQRLQSTAAAASSLEALAAVNLAAALESYSAALAIAERLAKADPGHTERQRDLSISHTRVGDVQRAQGSFDAALESYRATLAIAERLAQGDPSNSEWQRDLIISYWKLTSLTGDKAYAEKALDLALAMQQRGILAPRDAWMVDDLKRLAGR